MKPIISKIKAFRRKNLLKKIVRNYDYMPIPAADLAKLNRLTDS